MEDMNRRKFLDTGLAAAASASLRTAMAGSHTSETSV